MIPALKSTPFPKSIVRQYSKNIYTISLKIDPELESSQQQQLSQLTNQCQLSLNPSKLKKEKRFHAQQQLHTLDELVVDQVRSMIRQAVSKKHKKTERIEVELEDGMQGKEALDGAIAHGLAAGLYEFPKKQISEYLKEQQEEQKEDQQEEEKGLFDIFQEAAKKQAKLVEHQANAEGLIKGQSETMARFLCDMPSNILNPTTFCQFFQDAAKQMDNVEVKVRDEAFAKTHGMESFLAVSQGSAQPAKILELHYRGNPSSQDIDYVQVGKGITFDTGGISIKPSAGMHEMKGDMGGAATTCASHMGIAHLQLPINVTTIVFLCENMPGGNAIKPGDVVRSSSGKTIEILDTDAEGRLILADALTYASKTYPSQYLVDAATLTGAIVVALAQKTGVFCSSREFWQMIERAGKLSGDEMWPMPLSEDYLAKMKKSEVADLSNLGERWGGSNSAAAFLSEFVTFREEGEEEDVVLPHYAHFDIAGSCIAISGGMTGQPTSGFIGLAEEICNEQQGEQAEDEL